MYSDVVGRVEGTQMPRSVPLLGLFEAVINSLQAIEEANVRDGRVAIKIFRELATTEENDRNYILSFEVTDNGIGFTDENYRSFETEHSRHKSARGGKGVGRFIWLKTFDHVAVESLYAQGDNKTRRVFEFRRVQKGIVGHEKSAIASERELETRVRLVGFDRSLQKGRLAEHTAAGIAQAIVHHCLDYFVEGQQPHISVSEATDPKVQPINCNAVYQSLVQSSHLASVKLSNGSELAIRHFLLKSEPGSDHHVKYCANRRPVTDPRLRANDFPNLPARIISNDEKLVYAGYVRGEQLDQKVNSSRTSFRFPTERSALDDHDVTWGELEDAVHAEIGRYLAPHMDEIRQSKLDYIQDKTRTDWIEYRWLAHNHPELIDQIPKGIVDDPMKLEVELFKKLRDAELSHRIRAHATLAGNDPERFGEFVSEWNELGKTALAKYVAHRKRVLELFEKRLGVGADGSFALEDAIHSLIFPLRASSDALRSEQQNLWMVDERLSYHEYLASDLEFEKIPVTDSTSNKRADLLIFDNPIAIIDEEMMPYASVTVIEFKRPERERYNEKRGENPVDQVLDYVQELRTNRAVDRRGRTIQVSRDSRFYCYIIADITDKLKTIAERRSMLPTADGLGYYHHVPDYRAYVEILSYEKILQDAKKRNRVLFEKLFLPR